MLLNTNRVRAIALSGILLALAVIFILLISVLPTGRLALYSLASFTVAIIIIETGAAYAWMYYLASCVLLLFIIPDKITLLPYALFFGLYGIIKYYLESSMKRISIIFEYILKLAVFNFSLAAGIIIALKLLDFRAEDVLKSRLPWWALLILFQLVFLVYDYAFSIFIGFYNNKVKKKT